MIPKRLLPFYYKRSAGWSELETSGVVTDSECTYVGTVRVVRLQVVIWVNCAILRCASSRCSTYFVVTDMATRKGLPSDNAGSAAGPT
jgi:hypothetical protein